MTFVENCCSCNLSDDVAYLPIFTCRGGEAPDPGLPTPVPDDDIQILVCSTCDGRAAGLVSKRLCFSCIKKKKILVGTKPGTSISFHTKYRCKENRTGAWVYGPIIAARAYLMAASTRVNEIKALTTRQLAPTPKVNIALYQRLKQWVVQNREDIFPGLTNATCAFGPRSDQQFEQWNAKFPKATRGANARAWPLVKRDFLSERMLRKYTTIKLFLKAEKYDKADIGVMDTSLAPRCISSWVAFVNVATFALTLFHHYLVGIWGDYTRQKPGALKNICFPAGMNSSQMSEWFTDVMGDSASLVGYEIGSRRSRRRRTSKEIWRWHVFFPK